MRLRKTHYIDVSEARGQKSMELLLNLTSKPKSPKSIEDLRELGIID